MKDIISGVCTACWLLGSSYAHYFGQELDSISHVDCASNSCATADERDETVLFGIGGEDIVRNTEIRSRTNVGSIRYSKADDISDDPASFPCFKYAMRTSAPELATCRAETNIRYIRRTIEHTFRYLTDVVLLVILLCGQPRPCEKLMPPCLTFQTLLLGLKSPALP